MVARVALLAAIASAAACYTPAFKDCELACSPGGMCPDGFECVGQVCRSVGVTTECTVAMPDAPANDSMMSDAPGIPAHPTTPWGAPVRVPLPQFPQGMDDVSLTGDLLELHGSVGNRILVATRTSPTGAWSQFSMAPGVINSTDATFLDDAPTITSDGLTMYWMSNRPGGTGGNDIWMATRPARGAAWVNAVNVARLNSPTIDSGGSVSADDLFLVMSSDRGGNGVSSDLYLSTRSTPTGAWSTPVPLQALNASANDSHAVLSPDKLTIYFHSNRIAGADFEIFEAHRSTPTGTFGAPRQLTELSTVGYDGDPWVSPDGRHMFFDRLDGNGIYQVYESSR